MSGHVPEGHFAPSSTMYELEVSSRTLQTRDQLLAAAFSLAVYADLEFGMDKPEKIEFSLRMIAKDAIELAKQDGANARLRLWDNMDHATKHSGLGIVGND